MANTQTAETQVKRWSARRKMEVILRLFRGEDIEEVSRDVGVTVARLDEWRQEALFNLEQGFKQRVNDPIQKELSLAKERIGDLSMEVELFKKRVEKSGPLVLRRSKK